MASSGNSNFDELPNKHKVVAPPQDETAQRAVKSRAAVFNSVHDLLECPVCLNTMYPPIYQCFNGHPLCSGCKPMMKGSCPICRNGLGNIRCLTLEKVAEPLELPCKYENFGCVGIFPYCNRIKHESQCSFRPYNCPSAGFECSVIGDISFLVSHLKDSHKVFINNESSFDYSYVKSNPCEVENATWFSVCCCYGKYFCLHFEAFQLGVTPVYIAFLRLMGDDEEAKNYSYSLKFKGNGRNRIWQGVPRSIRDSHRKVRDSLDGLIIQQNFFPCRDCERLKLSVSGRIWKEQ